MLVYIITNKINGKQYVGQHSGNDLNLYWQRNVYLAQNGYQGKRLLYRAICKYGPDNFDVEVLTTVKTKEEMDRYEIGVIAHLDLCNPKKGYNITAGGGGSLGVKMSEETRAKMSASRTGLKMPKSHSEKLSNRNKGNKYAAGRKMTEDNHAKLMAVHVGAKRSEETKKRLSDTHKGKKQSESTVSKRAEGLALGKHVRWHVNRDIINPDCKFCTAV